MMKLVPRALIDDWIDPEAPEATPTMAITQATPMTMPSMVSAERSLLRLIACRPTLTMLSVRSNRIFIAFLLPAGARGGPSPPGR